MTDLHLLSRLCLPTIYASKGLLLGICGWHASVVVKPLENASDDPIVNIHASLDEVIVRICTRFTDTHNVSHLYGAMQLASTQL